MRTLLLTLLAVLAFAGAGNAADEYSIRSNNGDGIIVLDNGSVLEIAPLDRLDTMFWMPLDDVVVIDHGFDATVINTDSGENVSATFLDR